MPGIRPATPEDTPRIHALIAEIFADYGYVLDAENEDKHLALPGPYFRANGGEFWVVEHDGAIIACVAVYLHEDAGELKSLYVRQDQRRQGWGRRLTELAMDHARNAGRTRMVLWSDVLFAPAHRLYESLGFQRTGVRHIKCTNTFSEYSYELGLSPG